MIDRARVVVIGGGIGGCSILYWLARLGWSDVALVERSELTKMCIRDRVIPGRGDRHAQ